MTKEQELRREITKLNNVICFLKMSNNSLRQLEPDAMRFRHIAETCQVLPEVRGPMADRLKPPVFFCYRWPPWPDWLDDKEISLREAVDQDMAKRKAEGDES